MNDTKRRILVVDDEQSIRESLRLLLKSNFEVMTAEDGLRALELVGEFNPHLILLDVMMPRLDGIDTLRKIREAYSNIPVLMLTAANTVKTAVEAMKLGATDYLSKPFEIGELTTLIVEAIDGVGSQLHIEPSGSAISAHSYSDGDFGAMMGRSSIMKELYQQISQIAEKDTTVLVTGESGTGKELVAREIHKRSKRSKEPFIPINCAAIPETLIESELFGHEKGSFTNAYETRIGQFEAANGGTLFLDEIGELPLTMQVKMLRFLQEQEFYRIGRPKPIKVDVRVICATNRNLEELIKEKKLRQDLFYRINVVNLVLPPLRDRYEDIGILFDFFVKKLSPYYDNRVISLEEDALEAFVQYAWPGNVRELENAVESLMALSPSSSVSMDSIPVKIARQGYQDTPKTAVFEGSLKFEEAEKIFETEMILKALKKTNFVQTRAAELLGISRRILKYKMDKLGISEVAQVADVESR